MGANLAGRIRKDEVLSVVRATPGLDSQRLAERMGVSRKAVDCHLYRLAAEGLVENLGCRNGGSVPGLKSTDSKSKAAWHPAVPRPKRLIRSVFDLG